jgi:nitric oxide reductase subunit B
MALVPAGIYQAWASITKGMWFARSPEVIHSAFMENMVWLRVPGDIVFALGTLCLALFVLRVLRRPARPIEVPIEIGGRIAAKAARPTTKA